MLGLVVTLTRLVDLLNGWASTCIATIWHATRHATLRGTTSSLVHLGDDRVANSFEVFLHRLELLLLGMLSSLQPCSGLVDLGLDGFLVLLVDCCLEFLLVDGVLHGVAVRLEAILGVDLLLSCLVLVGKLLGLTHHALNVVLGQPALVVGDGNVGFLTRGTLVLGSHIEHTISIDVEGHLDLRNPTRGRGDPSKLELAKKVVVLGAGTLAFENLDEDTRLVVGVSGQSLGLLGWHSGVASNEGGHDTTSSLQAEREWCHVQQQQVGFASGATGEHTGLHSSTVGHSLIGVDGAARLLAIEEVADKLVDLRDTGGATNHDDLVHGALVNLGVAEDFLHRLESSTEQVGT